MNILKVRFRLKDCVNMGLDKFRFRQELIGGYRRILQRLNRALKAEVMLDV